MNRKNILIISCVFPPEPIVSANISFDIANELSIFNDVTVLSPQPSRPYGTDFPDVNSESLNFSHEVLDSFYSPKPILINRLIEGLSFGRACSKWIKHNGHEIDIIYANTWPLIAQYFLAKVCNKMKIPLVLHVQDIYPESIISKLSKIPGWFVKQLTLPLDKYILNSTDKIISISENMREYLMSTRGIHQNKIVTIRNWQNVLPFIGIQSITTDNRFTFMYLGSISPSAGVELLIKAFSLACIDNTHLIIAGSGSERQRCVDLAETCNADISFISAPLEDVPYIQSKADVLLLPLKRGLSTTASPSKLAAYMFSKKPIIASVEADSDTAQILLRQNAGWVIEPENEVALAAAMKQAFVMPQSELQELGKNGFNFAFKELNRDINLKRIVNEIMDI